VTRTYVDSGVLIASARGQSAIAQRADAVLNDPTRAFLTSDIVRLEVRPKARFHRQAAEIELYETFFATAVGQAAITPELIDDALALAATWNLNALDALHLAAVLQLQADELVTTERPSSPLPQVQRPGLRISTIL
jgi:predicted nucleic acid-binding protein